MKSVSTSTLAQKVAAAAKKFGEHPLAAEEKTLLKKIGELQLKRDAINAERLPFEALLKDARRRGKPDAYFVEGARGGDEPSVNSKFDWAAHRQLVEDTRPVEEIVASDSKFNVKTAIAFLLADRLAEVRRHWALIQLEGISKRRGEVENQLREVVARLNEVQATMQNKSAREIRIAKQGTRYLSERDPILDA